MTRDLGQDDPLIEWLREGGLQALDFATGGALDVIGIVDRQLVVRYVNWTAPDITREAVIGCDVLDLAPPDYRELARTHYEAVLRTGVGSRFETSFQGKDHLLMWEVRVGPIRFRGEVIGLVTMSTEVTEQRRAEADRDRFFALSLDMLVVASPTGKLKRINQAFGDALGYALTTLVDQPFASLVHPEDQRATALAFEGVLAGKPITDFENRYRRANGDYRVFSWRATVDPLTKDVYAVARDITDKREVEAQLRHAQKMEAVGQLAGGVAHDFNNLMQAVLANTELAARSLGGNSALAERLAGIEDAANRAAALTKGLLAFSRRQPLRPVSVDLNELIGGLGKILRSLLPENISTEFVSGLGLSRVSVDRTQLEQVIVNLAINARDAMERGGKLTLTTENVLLDPQFCESHAWAKPGRWVRLTVTDTGTGMAPEVRERVFEPFFTTKGPLHGTGLGLATAYGIVRQHGGMIQVHSDLGKGATFEIYLPEDTSPPGKPAHPPATRHTHGQETILVAEDEAAVRRAVVEVLERAGYQVLAAIHGTDAVRRLREHNGRVHLALLDVVMPELDGPETWQQLSALRSDLRVLFMSGYADARHRQRLPPGAQLMSKPFPMHDLLTRIREVLDG